MLAMFSLVTQPFKEQKKKKKNYFGFSTYNKSKATNK